MSLARALLCRKLAFRDVIFPCSSFRSLSKEVDKAEAADPSNTIFTKIINKEVPADILHEDDKCVAFRDVNPVAPTHVLVIPRKPIPSLSQADNSEEETKLLGHLLQVSKQIAQREKLEEGFRIGDLHLGHVEAGVSSYLRTILVAYRTACLSTSSDLPSVWKHSIQFATKDEDQTIDPETTQLLVENLQELDSHAFQSDQVLLQDLIQFPKRKPLGVILLPSNTNCSICGNKLQLRKDRPSSVVVYDDNMGTVPASHFHKVCTNRTCGCTQYYGYYTTGSSELSSKVLFNDSWESLPYFVSSRETAFSMSAMYRFTTEVLLGQLSFKQCADIYNHFHDWKGHQASNSIAGVNLLKRYQLDRRRIESSFFQFAVLRLCSWYPEHFAINALSLHNETENTILQIISQYHGVFMDKYSKHRCSVPGCRSVIVIDGNMKNHRNVCFATHAGFAEYGGLPESIRTGCPNSPAYKSQFCSIHKPTVPTGAEDSNSEERMIIGKRVTRQGALYEVATVNSHHPKTTWEPASQVENFLIEEFEGIADVVESFSFGGQTIHTTKKSVHSTQSESKRPRRDASTIGFFDKDLLDIQCNTAKDKGSVKHKTAGIMMGARPCGIIIMLNELFGSESISQVYGLLHAFLHNNKDCKEDLKFICYDDACHLKKYVANPKRKDATEITNLLASLNIVVDKMHFKNHVDSWCKENCNPYKFTDLEKVDTEACEQIFSWMSRYAKITRHMNRVHFLFYLLYLSDLHNRR